MLTDFNNIRWLCSWENLQTNDLSLSYNIQFMYEYYRITRQILFAFNVAALSIAVVPVSHSFFKSLFSPRSAQPLFRNFIINSFAPQPLKSTNFLSKLDLRR